MVPQHEAVEAYRDGSVGAYEDALIKVQQDISVKELNIALSEDTGSLMSHPGWTLLMDRLRQIQQENLGKLRRKLEDYPQGRVHGQLDVLDVVLKTAPMKPQEIDNLRDELTVLRSTEAEYQEILR